MESLIESGIVTNVYLKTGVAKSKKDDSTWTWSACEIEFHNGMRKLVFLRSYEARALFPEHKK
ncbi:MAG: hypothetical protein WCJ60_04420 [bacterium]